MHTRSPVSMLSTPRLLARGLAGNILYLLGGLDSLDLRAITPIVPLTPRQIHAKMDPKRAILETGMQI